MTIATYGWRDMRAPFIGGRLRGISDPSLASFGPGSNVQQFSFSIGNEVLLAFHVDHDILEGSTMYPHIHWSTNGTDTSFVKWELNLTMAERNDDTPVAFGAEQQFLLKEPGSGTAWGHMVTEDQDGFAAPAIDSLILGHIKRITNGGTDNTDTVFGLFVDMHYEVGQYATPSRAPDFFNYPEPPA